jgi:hypothetical protein
VRTAWQAEQDSGGVADDEAEDEDVEMSSRSPRRGKKLVSMQLPTFIKGKRERAGTSRDVFDAVDQVVRPERSREAQVLDRTARSLARAARQSGGASLPRSGAGPSTAPSVVPPKATRGGAKQGRR